MYLLLQFFFFFCRVRETETHTNLHTYKRGRAHTPPIHTSHVVYDTPKYTHTHTHSLTHSRKKMSGRLCTHFVERSVSVLVLALHVPGLITASSRRMDTCLHPIVVFDDINHRYFLF